MIVATERLGLPGDESSRLERSGIVQRRLVYPTDSTVPTATCHEQLREDENALCGFPCEALVAVPGVLALEELDPSLRCPRCLAANA